MILGLQVTLSDEVSSEGAEELANAIRCLRGVADVQPVQENMEYVMTRMRVRR